MTEVQTDTRPSPQTRVARANARMSRPTGSQASPQGPVRRATNMTPAGRVSRAMGGGKGFKLKSPSGGQSVVMVEFILAVAIIGMRAAADYVPASDESQTGSEAPAKGVNPLSLFAANCVAFAVLAFVGARGGNAAKAAGAFGALILVALLVNSQSEMGKVSTWVDTISGKNSPAASAQPGTDTAPSSTSTTPSSGGIYPTPTGAAPSQYLSFPTTEAGVAQAVAANGVSAVSNASSAASRALSSAWAAASQKALAGPTVVELTKALSDESTAAADQIAAVIKRIF